MGAPPTDEEREPGTRPDGEAMPPAAIDPAAQGSGKAIPPLPEPNVEGVGNEGGDSAEDTASQHKLARDGTGF